MNSKQIMIALAPLCVVVMAAAAIALFRTPAGASEPIQAVSLATQTREEPAAATEPVVDTAGETESTTIGLIFEIDPNLSTAQFAVDEVLRGSPFTAVGVTNEVAGQIALDPADLSTAQLGVFQVNARTLATDDDFRNRALNNHILNTDQYEYITFTPTALVGLPGSASVGETANFTIIGDLTIRDVTQQVAFEATVTLVSESELQGTARATILRSDYDLTIPSVPQVAEVSDELLLTIDFVATTV